MNARRDFNPVPEKEEEKTHIAFEDKCKLLEPEQAMLCTPSAPRIQVVALANWERATTFVLDDHLQTNFPNVSADRLLNKCNPFLSGKRRVQKDDGDIGSEAPTTSTACSTLSENDGEEHELNMVEKEEHAVHTPPKSPKQTREGAGKPVSVPGSNQDQKKAQDTTSNNWVVNSGRPVDSEQAQRTAKAPVSSTDVCLSISCLKAQLKVFPSDYVATIVKGPDPVFNNSITYLSAFLHHGIW
ncbi:hypothetical protein PsorP6_001835 [Peronosclerospora sorghi]|uniref:Uncharacterized protein n=1 Tax=Peronosclerospora sorghi TaxID=230839 RepID=A0ACC0WY98_9STRA|nr:hypothetical protein PsorP6_001835 [Peronosclerospora sorghi]